MWSQSLPWSAESATATSYLTSGSQLTLGLRHPCRTAPVMSPQCPQYTTFKLVLPLPSSDSRPEDRQYFNIYTTTDFDQPPPLLTKASQASRYRRVAGSMLSMGKPFLAFDFKAMNRCPSPISRAILIRSSRVKISNIIAMIHVDSLGRSQNAVRLTLTQ